MESYLFVYFTFSENMFTLFMNNNIVGDVISKLRKNKMVCCTELSNQDSACSRNYSNFIINKIAFLLLLCFSSQFTCFVNVLQCVKKYKITLNFSDYYVKYH